MKSFFSLALPACILAFSAAAQTDSENTVAVDAKSASKRCISTRQLKSTVVLDDANILFFMVGSAVYRNQLPEACNGLLRYKTFSYRQIAGRICEADVIDVHRNDNPSITTRCRIGNFQSINSQDIPALISALHRGPVAESLPSADVEDISNAPETDESQPPE